MDVLVLYCTSCANACSIKKSRIFIYVIQSCWQMQESVNIVLHSLKSFGIQSQSILHKKITY